MIGATKMRGSHLPEVRGHFPQTNWSKHANAFECIPSLNKFMGSNFLYSLESEKPKTDREMTSRSIENISPVTVQTLARPQIEKAWCTLINLSIYNTYLRPGITPAIDDGITNCSSSTKGSTVKVTSNADRSFYAHNQPEHSQRSLRGTAKSFDSFSSSSVGDDKITIGKVPWVIDQVRDSVTGCKYTNGMEIPPIKTFALPARQVGLEEIDDDIIEIIDVDQIVKEHYHSTCTPQPSVSKFTPIASSVNIFAPRREEEQCLPPELCSNCSHGIKLGVCPEASTHVEQMKDTLLAISNETLDNTTGMGPDHVEQLRQKRLLLQKQIQRLEILIQNKERKKSQCLVSTPAHNIQYETHQTTNHKVVYAQTDSRAHVKEQGSYVTDNWNIPRDDLFSEDRYGISSGPVERDHYVPDIIDVTYTESSNDKKWSSRDFPWTKNLEVYNKIVFGNHSFRPNQREIINATMSGCDVFVLMPTGGGKSLTYQLPALLFAGITLVISPLVSLIQDQIMNLLQTNISAASLSAGMEWAEQLEIFQELSSENSKYKLLYVTPEKVAK